jgi:hypothetical protein
MAGKIPGARELLDMRFINLRIGRFAAPAHTALRSTHKHTAEKKHSIPLGLNFLFILPNIPVNSPESVCLVYGFLL